MATVSAAPRTTTFTTVSTTAGPFNITFRLFDTDSLDVYLNGVRTTGFTVAATFANGFTDSATLTLTTAVVSGTQIIIDGALTPRRAADYLPGDAALVSKLNIELPRIWSTLSEIKRDSERSVRSLTAASDPFVPVAGATVIYDGTNFVPGPTATAIADAQENAEIAAASAALILAEMTTVLAFGAVGDGVTNDTAAFTAAAAANRYVRVPYRPLGYNVANTVNGGSAVFIFEGAFITTQLVGTATRDNLRYVCINNGQITAERLRIEPPPRTLTGANEGEKRGLFIRQIEPNLAATPGDGNYFLNQITATWDGARTGTGIEGGPTSATLNAFHVGIGVGGPSYSLASVAAIGAGVTQTVDDSSAGDKVGINCGVATFGDSPGKIYGTSSSFTIGNNGYTPQAIGNEVDVFIQAGGETPYGLGFNAWSGGTLAATQQYAAYAISRSGDGSAVPWNTGILLYSAGGALGQGISTTGSLIGADASATLANIINLPFVTVTGFIINSPNAKLLGNGELQVSGGVTITGSAAGVNFTAGADAKVNGATATTNTLKDYEEGDWNPTFTGGGTPLAVPYVVRVGKYTRVGNMVTAWGKIALSSLGGLTGTLTIGGLPFNVVGNVDPAVSIGQVTNFSLGSDRVIRGWVLNGASTINLTTETALLTVAQFTANGVISFRVTYPVA